LREIHTTIIRRCAVAIVYVANVSDVLRHDCVWCRINRKTKNTNMRHKESIYFHISHS